MQHLQHKKKKNKKDITGSVYDTGTGTSLDKDSQIVLDERETVAEDVPNGLLGAVMVETCITIPRGQNVEAEHDYVGLLYTRTIWVIVLAIATMGVQVYLTMRLFVEIVLVRRAFIEEQIIKIGLQNIWAADNADVMP